jgi:HAD superfamily hydrolase (TIGR01509 family)
MMDRSNLRGHLDVVLSNEDVEKPKPDSEIYKKAITLMGVSPSQTMIVEDNDHGIKAAKDSGANVMVVESTEDVNWANILENLDRFNRI